VADLFEESAIMKKILLAAALTAVCGVAAAQGYAGALIGMGKIDGCIGGGISCDDSDTAFKIYGGYELGEGWSAELAYTNFGELTLTSGANTLKTKVTGFSVAAAYRYSFNSDITGVARIGLGMLDGKNSGGITNVSVAVDDSAKLMFGLGLEYNLADNIKLVGAFDAISADATLFGIGAQVGF
jgi:OmpA-OmpF porin, OOP family